MFQRILQDAKDRDVNEADTATIVKEMFSEVFGFDKFTEITSECAVQKTFCDLAVKLEDDIFYLVEVKAIGLTLKDNHLRQAVNYGSNHGITWVVLTNGITWEIYCVVCEGKVTHELICSFNFLEISARKAEDREKLFLLCRRGVAKKAIEDYQQHVQVVNRFIVSAILRTEPVLKAVRRELKRLAPRVKTTEQQVESILVKEILKREVMDGDAAEHAAKKVKKSINKQKRQAEEEVAVASNEQVG